ncbi:glycerophosphodiester phosphodiesterase family protein [Leifsonia bigeumensis]|uniref:Glycerophosphodiester phosphodiesterase family protein n=2 Tax=Leifsonella bigeumensis TaxID=433643 RepID=A0ABP7FTR8_9MICO
MATAHHPRALTTRRGMIVSVLVLGFVLAIVLNPDASKVEASGWFGGLRSPGEAAFIAGHRGDRTIAPENTMPALQAALDGPMGFVETDIQLTKDRVPVLMHDTWVDRTTNGEGRVGDLTLAQLQALDAGAWFSPEFAGTRVPTLESLLSALQASEAAGAGKKALLEFKGFWTTDEVRIVVDLIRQYAVARLVILSSFDPVTLQHVEEVDGTIPRAIITAKLPSDPVRLARLYGAIAIITSQAAVEADRWVVDRIHRAGLGIILYTLNTKERWSSALDLGVDGIITDRPDRLGTWMSAKVTG